MSGIAVLWSQPRKHWLRKALFQIHLWLGIIFRNFRYPRVRNWIHRGFQG